MTNTPLVECGAIPTQHGWLIVALPPSLVLKALSLTVSYPDITNPDITINGVTFRLQQENAK